MSRIMRNGRHQREDGRPEGRAAAFNRWLPLFAGGAGRQGGWAAEALTTGPSCDTYIRRLNAAVRPPACINRAPRASAHVRNLQPVPSRSRRTSTEPLIASRANVQIRQQSVDEERCVLRHSLIRKSPEL